MSGEDILVEIPDDRLPDLANLYKINAAWAPYMSTLIHTAIKWKKCDAHKNLITVLSPSNSWLEDGTIVVLITVYTIDIHVFSLDDKCTNLLKGLLETKQIKYNEGRHFFYGVHERFMPTVKTVIEKKKLNMTSNVPCHIYTLAPEEAKKYVLDCPTDVFIKKLQPSDATTINNLWPHRFHNSDKHIAGLIEMNGGYGVFLNSTNDLVAWVVRHVFGNLTMLQTDDHYKRKGYASLMIKTLAKEIGEEGYWSVGPVVHNNKKAISMFEKLGFRAIGTCAFITVE